MDFGDDNACSSTEATNTVEIVNETQRVLDMRVRNSVYSVRLGRLRRGATHTLLVSYTDTYQVYEFSPRRSSKEDTRCTSTSSVLVTSDDCCDNMRIIITEVDGQLVVQRERRVYSSEEEIVSQENSATSLPPPGEVLQRDPASEEVIPRESGSYVGAFILNWIRPGIV